MIGRESWPLAILNQTLGHPAVKSRIAFLLGRFARQGQYPKQAFGQSALSGPPEEPFFDPNSVGSVYQNISNPGMRGDVLARQAIEALGSKVPPYVTPLDPFKEMISQATRSVYQNIAKEGMSGEVLSNQASNLYSGVQRVIPSYTPGPRPLQANMGMNWPNQPTPPTGGIPFNAQQLALQGQRITPSARNVALDDIAQELTMRGYPLRAPAPQPPISQIIPREQPALTQQIANTPRIGGEGYSPEAIAGMETINRYRAAKGLPPIQPSPLPRQMRDFQRERALERLKAFRQSKGLPPLGE
jgi:hypothetical protein